MVGQIIGEDLGDQDTDIIKSEIYYFYNIFLLYKITMNDILYEWPFKHFATLISLNANKKQYINKSNKIITEKIYSKLSNEEKKDYILKEALYYNASSDKIINDKKFMNLSKNKSYIAIPALFLIGKKKHIIKNIIEFNEYLKGNEIYDIDIPDDIKRIIEKHVNENPTLKKLYNLEVDKSLEILRNTKKADFIHGAISHMYITILKSGFEPFQFFKTKKYVIRNLDKRFLADTYLAVAIINEILNYTNNYTFEKLYNMAIKDFDKIYEIVDDINNNKLEEEIKAINEDYGIVMSIFEDDKLEKLVNQKDLEPPYTIVDKYGDKKSLFKFE